MSEKEIKQMTLLGIGCNCGTRGRGGSNFNTLNLYKLYFTVGKITSFPVK